MSRKSSKSKRVVIGSYDRIFASPGEVVIIAIDTRRSKDAALGYRQVKRAPTRTELEAAIKLLDKGEFTPPGKRKAPAGKHWVRNIMSNEWVLEDSDTPFTSSVASETYWSS